MLYDWKLFKNIGYDIGQNFTTFDKYLSVSSPIICQVKMTCINANKKNQSYHISLVSILFIFQITSLDFFYTSVWVLVRVRFTLGVYLSAQVTGVPCSSERCGKRESIQVHTVVFCSRHTIMMFVSVFVHPYNFLEGYMHDSLCTVDVYVSHLAQVWFQLSVRRVGLSPACFLPFVWRFRAFGASASKNLQSDSLKLWLSSFFTSVWFTF